MATPVTSFPAPSTTKFKTSDNGVPDSLAIGAFRDDKEDYNASVANKEYEK